MFIWVQPQDLIGKSMAGEGAGEKKYQDTSSLSESSLLSEHWYSMGMDPASDDPPAVWYTTPPGPPAGG